MPWTKEHGEYHFQVGEHRGNGGWYAEICIRDYTFQPSPEYKGWRQEELEMFDTEEEAFRYLGKFGYHNVGRFLKGV